MMDIMCPTFCPEHAEHPGDLHAHLCRNVSWGLEFAYESLGGGLCACTSCCLSTDRRFACFIQQESVATVAWCRCMDEDGMGCCIPEGSFGGSAIQACAREPRLAQLLRSPVIENLCFCLCRLVFFFAVWGRSGCSCQAEEQMLSFIALCYY